MNPCSKWTQNQESYFLSVLRRDISNFLKDGNRKKILVLPRGLNKSHRFSLHSFVESEYEGVLSSFSVGQKYERRMVITYKELKPRGVEESPVMAKESSQVDKKHTLKQTQPTYIPPALRRKDPALEPSASSSQPGSDRKSQPRPIKMCENSHLLFSLTPRSSKDKPTLNISPQPEKTVEVSKSEPAPKLKKTKKRKKSEKGLELKESETLDPVPSSVSSHTPQSSDGSFENETGEEQYTLLSETINSFKITENSVNENSGDKICGESDSPVREARIEQIVTPSEMFKNDKNEENLLPCKETISTNQEPITQKSVSGAKPKSQEKQKKIKAAKAKKSLEGNTPKANKDDSPKDSLSKREINYGECKENTPGASTLNDLNDWEQLYENDNLLSNLDQEIKKTVGTDVKFMSCSQLEQALNEEDLETDCTIEIYNIPQNYRTEDLMKAFMPYVPRGFHIKWVDDTHALGIFSASSVAREVLETDIPPFKTRSLRYATGQSQEKAKNVQLPSSFRPKTCQAIARRLITGALGIRVKTSQQQRDVENRVLKEARDEKRLAAKQKEDAWEGFPSSS